MRIFTGLIAAVIALSACAPIQHTAVASKPVNAVFAAGPGDVIVRVDKKRNLVNAFGGADVWGRQTDEGFSELAFGGVDADGSILLFRRGASILTNETSMSRSGVSQSFSSANGQAAFAGNTANFSGTETTATFRSPSDYHIAVPVGALAIRVPKGTVAVPFEGYTVELLAASSASLSYRVRQGNTSQ